MTAEVAVPTAPGERRERLTGVRKFIAARMVASLAQAAQISFHADCDASRLFALRAEWKAAGVAISIEDCLIAALARTLVGFPELNGVGDGDDVVYHNAVHVAVAIAGPHGLRTPVVRDANRKSLLELADCRANLVTRARSNTLKVSEMKGGTVTVSNLGQTRVDHFTPILNAGQLVLLGIGRARPQLALTGNGAIIERRVIGLSLTVDHRIVDGDPAARFLTQLCEEIERFDPGF